MSSFSSSSSDSDLEAGFSGCAPYFIYSTTTENTKNGDGQRKHRRSGSKGSDGILASSRLFCDYLNYDEPRHFLDSCFLCKRPLAGNRDIFMYKGDAPFCSEDCRQEQIDIDEAEERKLRLSIKIRSKEQQKGKASAGGAGSPESENIHVRSAGTVVAG